MASTSSSGKALPKQDVQTDPNPDLQAALTADSGDRQELHETTSDDPTPAEERSAEAPGIRTEAEVIAAHEEANERAAAALAAAPHTADPAYSTSAVKDPRVPNPDRLVHFKRKSDGVVQSVNEGTPEHGIMLHDTDFEATTRAEAVKAAKG